MLTKWTTQPPMCDDVDDADSTYVWNAKTPAHVEQCDHIAILIARVLHGNAAQFSDIA